MQALHNTPGKLFMQIRHLSRHLALGLALATPVFAQANYSINNSVFSCSAGLSFADSQGLDAHCTGNFSVTGGTWTSDTKISLTVDGDITLDGVTMTAPVINLAGLGQITITSNTVLNVAGRLPSNITQPPSLSGGSDRPSQPRPGSETPANGSGAGDSLEISAGGDINTSGSFTDSSNGDDRRPQAGSIQIRENAPLIVSGTITTDSSQTPLTFSTTVPEPETYTLALAALATLGAGAALARRRQA
jgi:hypothetical protein